MATCSESECTTRVSARGLCPRNYARRNAAHSLPAKLAVIRDLPDPVIAKEDAIYLAGLFDGEGTICVAIAPPKPPRRPTPRYQLLVAVTMLDRPAIATFHRFFGGGLNFDGRNGPHQTMARWYCSAWRAVRVVKALRPFLRVKRQQADLALAFMETFRHDIEGRKMLPPHLLAERKRLCDEMSLLNHSHWRKKRLRRVSS